MIGESGDMNRDDLIARSPRLFHMAEAGSWPIIQRYGLMTTEHLVRTARLPRSDEAALLEQRRSASTRIAHPIYGEVVIRDQGPLNLTHLQGAVTDVTVQEWLAILNSRVFFWLHPDKLAGLLNARRYRNQQQDVLTIDTGSLLDAAGDRVRLSPVNSGATLYPNTPARGTETFRTIEDYDYVTQRRRRGPIDAIVELAVIDGVPDIANHVVEVRRMQGDTIIESLHP